MRKSNRQKTLWCIAVCMFMIAKASATDFYVDGNKGSNSRSGRSWAEARKTIQSAYSLAGDGDVIHVAEGVYGKISVNVPKAVVIKGEGGCEKTIVDGGGASRCVGFFLDDWSTADVRTTMEGFTFRNGVTEKAGGGAYGGRFRNCRFIGNRCGKSGGAAAHSILENCLVVSNAASRSGGAMYDGHAENCVLAGNACERYGGGAYDAQLVGCSVFDNSAGIGAGGVYEGSATNTIVWANRTGIAVNNWIRGAFGYCCTKPQPEGIGNFSKDPCFYSLSCLDGRICTGSPCLNVGCNDYVTTIVDVIGGNRIKGGIVDVGAYEGVIDGTGHEVTEPEKVLAVKPGVSSSFAFPDGSRAFIYGLSPLVAGDFAETDAEGVLQYENSQIIDAEKIASLDMDDYWCQQMTEVNLSVWSGWSQYVGFTNEDDMAEYLRGDSQFAESTNVLKWVLGRSGCSYNDYVSWAWASDPQRMVEDLQARTADAKSWVYLQLDWVTPGTTTISGSHAVTCCGYQLAKDVVNPSPSDVIGLFIINSDNDKGNGNGGRYAPNTVTRIPVSYDSQTGKFFLVFPGKTGMLRFLCFLKARPCSTVPVATRAAGIAVPYRWLIEHGLYDPKSGASGDEIVLQKNGKMVFGKELSVWHDYVMGTDPQDRDDVFSATIGMTNGSVSIGWCPNLGGERKYAVQGKTNLMDRTWLSSTNESCRFFRVSVSLGDESVGRGYGFISESELLATNRYVKFKGVPSYVLPTIVDAEKVEGTDLDDRGCGEAVGANLTVMTGWAQRAGYANEDDVYRTFYLQDGTADYGTKSVVQMVFENIPGERFSDYYEATGEFGSETFRLIEGWIRSGRAVGIKYLHGTPSVNEGNHVVTVWGLCKDFSYLSEDPRHYCAVIVSDSDDDKTGYARAEDAPNRVKWRPLLWNDAEGVYYFHDGFLVDCYSLAPPRK